MGMLKVVNLGEVIRKLKKRGKNGKEFSFHVYFYFYPRVAHVPLAR